ncbi:hypothetical protein LX64_00138 [Chitinophaga skermanii]|uniref:Uncharacterized protein n=1 Tax=Chitinophaga skermanii TaxID=331697 RepID=A0A327R2S1_9BACT|nr:hypothetical protein LX64_00138 [Chitinophaga skermanii]
MPAACFLNCADAIIIYLQLRNMNIVVFFKLLDAKVIFIFFTGANFYIKLLLPTAKAHHEAFFSKIF